YCHRPDRPSTGHDCRSGCGGCRGYFPLSILWRLERRDQPTTILILLPAGSRVSIPEAISVTGEAAMLRRARISASVSASGTTISNQPRPGTPAGAVEGLRPAQMLNARIWGA